MSVPIIGVEPALVGMLWAAESAGAATMAAGTSGAAPVMTTVLPPGSDPASMAVATARRPSSLTRTPLRAEMPADARHL